MSGVVLALVERQATTTKVLEEKAEIAPLDAA